MRVVNVIVGAPVVDMPVAPVPSRRFTCLQCGREVWLSERAGAPMADDGHPVWCLDCALATADVVQFLPAGEALQEVSEHRRSMLS